MYRFKHLFVPILLLLISNKSFATEPTLNILSYKVAIEPNIQEKNIHGSVVIKFRLPLHKNSFTLSAGNLQVDSITSENVRTFIKNGDKLTIELFEKRNLIEEIKIYYHGYPKRGLLFNQEKHQIQTIYFTGDWMICNDIPSDKATIDLSILVPKKLNCIASGELVKKEAKGEKTIYQWSQKFESPTYTYGFTIGEFQMHQATYNKIEVNSYAQNFTPEELSKIFIETPKIILFFEEKSGIKYGQISYSQVLIGDHYQEMSGFSVLKNSYGALVLKDSTETNLISHELAHQWWGNRITCQSLNHFWLNEALATYMSAAYNEYRFGKEKYNADIHSYYNVYQDIKSRKQDKPLVFEHWSNPTKDDRNIVYFKGAYVLHLLREELGENIFWKGLRNYSQKHFDKSVTTTDFQNAMEVVAQRSLSTFFNKWVY